jgi:hypothetical protein
VTGKLPGVDLAVIAAFTAAGISLVNVAITVRATSRGNLQQWRRGEVRPVVARILALSDQATREQHQAICLQRDRLGLGIRSPADGDQALKLRAEERDHWKNSRDARQKLSYEVAQLDLVGQKPVRDAAAQLLNAQWEMDVSHAQPARSGDPLEAFVLAVAQVKVRENALIDATRMDLGILHAG